MKLFLRLFALILTTGAAQASTTLTINVTGFTGGTSPGASVRIDLQNCNGAQVAGTGQIVPQSQTVFPVAGSVTVTLFSNSDGAGGGQILCNTNTGLKPYSYYSFNFIYQGVITSIGSYNLLPGTYQLSNLTPCVGTACIGSGGAGGNGVSKIIGGTGISVSPLSGIGNVTVSTTGASCSDCLITDPAGNQNTTALNTSRYVKPSDGEMGVAINAAFSDCSLNCTVVPVCGTYTKSTTINLTRITESFEGNEGCVVINDSGTKFFDGHLDGAHFSVLTPGGSIGGFTVNMSNSAAVFASVGSWIGFRMHDIVAVGPGGQVSQNPPGTSQAIVFQNTATTNPNWFERWSIDNVNIGGWATNFHFMAPTNAGTDSFGYKGQMNVFTNQGLGSTGILVDNGANVYHMLGLNYQFNLGTAGSGANPLLFDIAGTFNGQNAVIVGENAAQPFVLYHVRSTGCMQLQGGVRTFGGYTYTADVTSSTSAPVSCAYIGPAFVDAPAIESALPTVTNYPTSANTDTFTMTTLETNNQNAEAGYTRGLLTRVSDGSVTSYETFEAGLYKCFSTRNKFITPNNLVYKWCVDSSGNTTQPGSATATVFQPPTSKGFTELHQTANIATVAEITDVFGGIQQKSLQGSIWQTSTLQLTTGSTPCTSALAGLYAYTQVGSGSADLMQVCTKDAANVYAYRSIIGGGGGSGTITPSPQFQLPYYSAAGTASTLLGDSAATTDGAGHETFVSVATTGVAGAGGGMDFTEGTAATAASGHDIVYADSTAHCLKLSNNNGGFSCVTETIANGTSALGTGAIGSASCATVVTTTAIGTATTDVVGWGFNGDPTGVTGYTPVTSGALTIFAYPSSGNVNFKVCNLTSSSITPGAITLNWRITR